MYFEVSVFNFLNCCNYFSCIHVCNNNSSLFSIANVFIDNTGLCLSGGHYVFVTTGIIWEFALELISKRQFVCFVSCASHDI